MEMSHRVKSKFAMIASMIELGMQHDRAALESIVALVRVISRVHDCLQLSRWMAWSMCGNIWTQAQTARARAPPEEPVTAPGLAAHVIKYDRALVHSSQLLHHVRDEKRL